MSTTMLLSTERSEAWMRHLWAVHYEEVLRYALRRTDPHRAADVAAETFLTAWRRRDDVPGDAALPWLIGVARRTLANAHRSDRRWRALTERLAGTREVAPDPDQWGGSGILAQAFGALSARDREVLALVAWEELSPDDAAQALACSAVAFRVRLHRARTRLRAEIDARSVDAAHPVSRGTP